MIQRILAAVVLVLATGLAALFASVNTASIEVDVLYGVYELPQSLVIIGALVVGVFIGLACAALMVLRVAGDRRKLRKALRVAEAEVRSLRSLPMQNAD